MAIKHELDYAFVVLHVYFVTYPVWSKVVTVSMYILLKAATDNGHTGRFLRQYSDTSLAVEPPASANF